MKGFMLAPFRDPETAIVRDHSPRRSKKRKERAASLHLPVA
jgi:hypothetical protein